MKTVAIIAAAVSLVQVAIAATSPVFVGCYAPGLLDSVVANLLSGVANTLAFTNGATCATGCGTLGYEYSFYNPGITLLGITLLPSCYCASGSALSSSGLKEGYITTAQDSSGSACQNPVLSLGVIYPIYQVQRTQYNIATTSQVTLEGCYSSVTLTGGAAATTISNPDTCFTTCANWKYMQITPVGTGGTYTCQCGNTQTLGSSTTCGASKPVVYQNLAATVSSVARRRRRAEAIAARIDATAKICPGIMNSCLTSAPSAAGISFECLDTQYELESCGGCVNGHYIADYTIGSAITTSGVDCTTIEGVAFGAVSCTRGRCVASRCRPGYKLIAGGCYKEVETSFNFQNRALKPRF